MSSRPAWDRTLPARPEFEQIGVGLSLGYIQGVTMGVGCVAHVVRALLREGLPERALGVKVDEAHGGRTQRPLARAW